MVPLPPVTSEGRLWAYLSYASVFTGLPLFIFPLAQRNDAFALFHAKQAAMTYALFWVLFVVYFVVSFVTCGVGSLCVPIIFLAYVPAIHGLVLVTNDEWREPMGLMGGAERFLGNVQVEEKK